MWFIERPSLEGLLGNFTSGGETEIPWSLDYLATFQFFV